VLLNSRQIFVDNFGYELVSSREYVNKNSNSKLCYLENNDDGDNLRSIFSRTLDELEELFNLSLKDESLISKFKNQLNFGMSLYIEYSELMCNRIYDDYYKVKNLLEVVESLEDKNNSKGEILKILFNEREIEILEENRKISIEIEKKIEEYSPIMGNIVAILRLHNLLGLKKEINNLKLKTIALKEEDINRVP
ncbi:MAG: hypothetical protein QXJ28_02920, partial [Candidatus Pacearchaeota archaeon]